MRHDGLISISGALPDAPLDMPKQVLERSRRSIFWALRTMFSALSRP
jgi:hypothetical protein